MKIKNNKKKHWMKYSFFFLFPIVRLWWKLTFQYCNKNIHDRKMWLLILVGKENTFYTMWNVIFPQHSIKRWKMCVWYKKCIEHMYQAKGKKCVLHTTIEKEMWIAPTQSNSGNLYRTLTQRHKKYKSYKENVFHTIPPNHTTIQRNRRKNVYPDKGKAKQLEG